MKRQKLHKIKTLASAAVLALALMPTIAAAQEFSDLQSNGNLHLRGIGSFFIQGNTHFVDTNTARGHQIINMWPSASSVSALST
jgi:hypothetical protein